MPEWKESGALGAPVPQWPLCPAHRQASPVYPASSSNASSAGSPSAPSSMLAAADPKPLVPPANPASGALLAMYSSSALVVSWTRSFSYLMALSTNVSNQTLTTSSGGSCQDRSLLPFPTHTHHVTGKTREICTARGRGRSSSGGARPCHRATAPCQRRDWRRGRRDR